MTSTEEAKPSDNLRVIPITSFLGGLVYSMTQAVWQPFVLSLGAPMSTLGLLESLGGWKGLVTSVVQPVSGWLSDKLGRKPFIALGSIASLAAMSFYVTAGITGAWWWLLPGIMLLGMSMVATPANDSLVAESAHAGRRGTAYSILMASWMAPGILAPALGGFVADRWGFTPVFVLRMGLEALSLLLIVKLLRETVERAEGQVSGGDLVHMLRRMFVPPKNLRGLYLGIVADSFAWGLGLTLLFGMLNETFGFTTFQLGIMSGLSSLSWALSQIPIGRLVDRYGCKRFMVVSEIVALLVVTGWVVSSRFTTFALLHAGFGLSAAIWVPAELSLLANSAPRGQRGEILGQMAAFRGLGGFPAPYIGGLLYERFGFRGPVLANLVGVFVALLVILVAVKEPAQGGAEGHQ